MRELNNHYQPDQTITHFTHLHHPLHLTNHNPSHHHSNPPPPCSACKLPISGQIYSCHSCRFILHLKCSQNPKQIKHPFHQNHILTLLPTPIYPEGSFNCDACGKNGDGFSYHCHICNIDLHLLCASMPLSVSNSSHFHPLNLVFSPPYQNGAFSCDVCSNPGSKTWIYRCGICEFDSHLDCVNCSNPVLIQQMRTLPPISQTRIVQVQPGSIGVATPLFRPYNNNNSMIPRMTVLPPPVPRPVVFHPQNNGFGFGVASTSRENRMIGNGIVGNLFHGIVDGASQQAGQQLFQGLMGGGDGDGGDLVANLFN